LIGSRAGLECFDRRICSPLPGKWTLNTLSYSQWQWHYSTSNWAVADPPTDQVTVQLTKWLKGWSNNLVLDKRIKDFPQNVKSKRVGGNVNSLDFSVASPNQFPIPWLLPDLSPPPNYEWRRRKPN
jgi:hypothetical protein